MSAPTWTHALAVLVGSATGCVLVTALEQGLLALLRRAGQAARPMVDDPNQALRCERGLFTPGATALHGVRGLLVLAGLALWLGWAGHPLLYGAAALAGGAALLLELGSSHTVVTTPWQVAWRRSRWQDLFRREAQALALRQLPLAQIAAVHIVERPAAGRVATWLKRSGTGPGALRWWARGAARLGSVYLALELHNGGALKLPRTDLLFGRAALRRVANAIDRQLREDAQARRHALLAELRARRSAARLLPDPEIVALRRELAALRRHQQRPPALQAPSVPLLLRYLPDDTAPAG